MNSLYVIHPNVHLGPDASVGEFVVLGVPPHGSEGVAIETHIGAHAHIRSHSVIYAGNRIGVRFSTGHGILIREANEIGDDVSVGSHTVIEHHVTIGRGVRIHSNAFIPEFSTLEDDAWVGPNVVFTNAKYPLGRDAKRTLQGPRILSGAKIGANATILPGVTIGRHAVIGAGSVVVRDVPDGMVMAGNPAKAIRSIASLAAYADRVMGAQD